MAKTPCVFVVEDDNSIRMLLELALRSAGYDAKAFSGAEEALDAMQSTVPDAVLLDIMLEGMDGITALRRIRADERLARVPVMMLTAKDTESDKVLGLDAGADDYMTKPFSVLELSARVRALLRRGGANDAAPKGNYLCADDLRLDLSAREATLHGVPLELTYKEFELLCCLMRSAPGAISREALLQSVWGYDFIGESRTLDMHIGTLRAKLGDDSSAPRYIKTVRGVGYRFLPAVEEG
jgi:two-component system alkaline phosphatase synthesis response regulator PhoP